MSLSRLKSPRSQRPRGSCIDLDLNVFVCLFVRLGDTLFDCLKNAGEPEASQCTDDDVNAAMDSIMATELRASACGKIVE